MRAVFLDFGTVSHDDLDTTSLERVLPGIQLYPTSTDAEVDERIAGSEFILTNKLNISRARMRAVPGLRCIGLTATGTNNVDLEAARELGIAVCNIRDYCTVSVAQHVLGVMLSLTHRLREYGVAATDGTWSRSEQFTVPGAPIRELNGKVLGIIGFGTLGKAVAKAAHDGLGMRVLVAQRPGTTPGRDADTSTSIGRVRVTLDELLRSADVLSLHCPLTPATTGLIGKHELALHETRRAADQHRARRAGGSRCAGGGVAWWRPRRRGHRRLAAGAAGGRQPAVRAGHPQPDRHATHRLGRVRSAAARGGRAGAQYRGLPAWRSPRQSSLTPAK